MRWSNLITTGITAAVTAGLTLTLFGPSTVTANSPPQQAMQQKIGPASADVGGLEITIEPSRSEYAPGQDAAVTLTAYNPGEEAVGRTVQVRMTTVAAGSKFARMLPMPVERWKEDCEIYVEAGQKTRIELQTGVELAAGQRVRFHVQQGELALALADATVGYPEGKKLPRALIY